MNRTARVIVVRTILLILALGTLYFFLQSPFRSFEAALCAHIADWFTPHRALALHSPYILVVPYHSQAFAAFITPACSSLAPMMALLALGTILPPHTGARRFLAVLAAVIVVFVGNLIRIAGSVLAGVFAGRGMLVLFHNWVGSAFTFAYILGGFMLMIAVMLPSTRRRSGKVRDALTS